MLCIFSSKAPRFTRGTFVVYTYRRLAFSSEVAAAEGGTEQGGRRTRRLRAS
eukprot:NODE_5678_length_685_cov_3.559748_g4801_i0.p5 GENE.NODE_5678_length_685_cov_3.559748_g4801_i0~~NODE_5678_length_685_cov_3.559748_g4801_i0.p5  ORF type:complete len:52 (+),score=5.89 NODE_5678_length_685_cov_3.559748_g4801_i0:301-456(+)